MRKALGILSVAAFVLGIQAAKGQDASQSQSQSQTQAKASAKPSSSKPQAQQESVAEAARKAQEAKKNESKAPIVFDNDNIGAAAAGGTINVVGNAPAPSTAKAGQAGGASIAAASANDEASWRQKFADAHKKLQQDQADLAVMQRELAKLQVQYYPDPQKALKQSYTSEDVTKKQQAIAKKQKEIQADQQALSNLEDDLRKAGGDPAWARE